MKADLAGLMALCDSGLLTLEQANLVRSVVDEIKYLRKVSGAVAPGEDLSEIKNRVHPGRQSRPTAED